MFPNEQDLERYLRQLIRTHITSRYPHIYPLENKKAVDIVICRDGDHPALFILEVKLFQLNHGRLGVGTKQGGGFQPELIRINPRYFDVHLRWVLVDGRAATQAYLFVPTSTIRQYLSNGSISIKFNNVQLKIFTQVKGFSQRLH